MSKRCSSKIRNADLASMPIIHSPGRSFAANQIPPPAMNSGAIANCLSRWAFYVLADKWKKYRTRTLVIGTLSLRRRQLRRFFLFRLVAFQQVPHAKNKTGASKNSRANCEKQGSDMLAPRPNTFFVLQSKPKVFFSRFSHLLYYNSFG